MRYMGGKFWIRKEVGAVLSLLRAPGQVYFEPFVGGTWVMQQMENPRIASDGCEALITLYNAVQDGWIPPSDMPEVEFHRIRGENNPRDPLLAFCQFGCSFGGVWGGGYARGKSNYADVTKRNYLRKKNCCVGAPLHTPYSTSTSLLVC